MPRGGKRPGAGRPRKVVVDWQQKNLLRFQSRFADEDIDAIADAIKAALKVADRDSMKALPYIIGAAPKEVTVKGDEENPLRVKGYLKVSPDDWDKEG